MLRLWEYGVGDTVRQSTFVSIRRVEADIYELTSNVGVEVSLSGRELKIGRDKSSWEDSAAQRIDGFVKAAIRIENLSPDGRLYLLIER